MADVAVLDHIRYTPDGRSLEGWSESDLDAIRASIERHGVVVLRGAFDAAVCRGIRRAVFDYFGSHPPSNPAITPTTPNYWRLDDDPEKAAVKRVNQFFSSFYWNDDLAGEKPLLQAMSRFKHRVARLPETFTLAGIEDAYVTYPTITHYPRGGGRLNRHTDPKNIQSCVILASLSARGADYASGGLYVEQDGEVVDLDGQLQTGDIYLMNPQTVHGVSPVDADAGPPAWHDERGRWTLFPSLVEVRTTQGVKVAGLTDLGDAQGR
jgi:hypothetical protein